MTRQQSAALAATAGGSVKASKLHQKIGAIVVALTLLVGLGTGVGIVLYPQQPPSTSTTTTVPTANVPVASYFGTTLGSTCTSGSPCDVYNQGASTWTVATNSTASALEAIITADGTWYNTQPLYIIPPTAGSSSNQYTNVALTARASPCNSGFVGSGSGQDPSTIPMPNYTALNGSSDNPLTLYTPTGDHEYEIWQATQTDSVDWTGCWGGSMPMSTSTGTFPYNFGRSATGISEANIMISENDVYQATLGGSPTYLINHALGVAIARCNGGPLYPANRADCGSDAGQPHEGSYYRFAPGTTCGTGIGQPCNNIFARIVFNTILNYGTVVTDQAGGTVAWEVEQSSDWAAQGFGGTDPITTAVAGVPKYTVLANLPWVDLQQVVPPGCPSSGNWMGATGIGCPS